MKTAVYCGTRNVYHAMVTAAKSLVYHTEMDRIYFLIEDDTFPQELPDLIKTINVIDQPWFRIDGKNAGDHRTYMNLVRSVFSKILDEDKVLCLDNDTIVVDDISELWEIDLGKNYFAGVREPVKSGRFPYINFGVSLHNLQQLRDGMCDKLIEALNANQYACPLQDSIYELCKGRLMVIDGCYNVSNYTETSFEPTKIFHFAANPRFEQNALWQMYANSDWSER